MGVPSLSGMFIRRKKNSSGSVSVQVIDKSSGKYSVVKTLGSSTDESELNILELKGKEYIVSFLKQERLSFSYPEDDDYIQSICKAMETMQLAGPEHILGNIFDSIGFNKIQGELFRHLVISRVCFPFSKLRTVDYLYRLKGKSINVQRIYRYMDKINNTLKESILQISFEHTIKDTKDSIRIVFYDVTTLYFETDTQDDFRISGFSKEGRHSNPQILLGLLVGIDGQPLAYELYEGNKYEGATMLPVIELFAERYKLEELVIVADSGLLNYNNLLELSSKGYQYIIGARIKNEKLQIQEKILSLKLKSGEATEIERSDGSRLIVSYSEKRAKKDEANRAKGIRKLEKKVSSGKLSKSHINNKGYNKFLSMQGSIDVKIDYEKVNVEVQWDGLKGYITNTKLSKDEIIKQYGNLWNIEKAFRIAKSDLRIRPIFHRLRRRIDAHVCIAFCAYKVYKELEKKLKASKIEMSAEKAIEIANTIYKIEITAPMSGKVVEKFILKNDMQKKLMDIIS